MEEEPVTEQMARSFLLGDIDNAERQRIESLFLADPEIRQTILMEEDDLFEAYLEGNLSPDDAERFRVQYASAPVSRRKLRIVQSIRQHALANSQKTSAPASVLQKLRTSWLFNSRLGAPVIVSLVILVILGSVWMALRLNRTARENNQQASIERQLADLNSVGNLETQPPQMLSLTVTPIFVRSVHSSSELTLQSSTQVVELHLLWTQKEYPTYQANLARVGALKTFKLPPLGIEGGADGRMVRLRLPATLLENGLYRITVSGVDSHGASAITEEYDFLIRRR